MERFYNSELQLQNTEKTFTIYQKRDYDYLGVNSKANCQQPVGGGKGYMFMGDMLRRLIRKDEKILTLATHRCILNDQHFEDILKLLTPLAGKVYFINNSSTKFSTNLSDYFDPKIHKLDKLVSNLRRNYGKYDDSEYDDFKKLGNILREQSEYEVQYNNEDINEYLTYIIYKKNLGKNNFSSTIVNENSETNIRKIILDNPDKKFIIISTYDSLWRLGKIERGILKTSNGLKIVDADYDAIPIDTLYCDEAHELATDKIKVTEDDKEAFFKKNYKTLTVTNRFFFSATPKESKGDNCGENSFLMDNPIEFGKTLVTSYRQCVDIGQILSMYLHFVEPRDKDDFDNNITNRSEFVFDAFSKHAEKTRKISSNNKIGGKVLVKCRNIKDDAKGIYDNLRETGCQKLEWSNLENLFVCVGGSYTMGEYNENGDLINGTKKTKSLYKISEFEKINDKWTLKKETDYSRNKVYYLKAIQKMKITDNAIVLHYDTLSEGINVNGFTGVMFISGNLLEECKIIQNMGRASRLTKIDRIKLKAGLISLKDKDVSTATVINKTWEKPFFSVIIPSWDDDSDSASNIIINIVMKLRNLLGERIRIVRSSIATPDGNDKQRNRSRRPEDVEIDDPYDVEFEHNIQVKIKEIEQKEIEQKEEVDDRKLIDSVTEAVMEEYEEYTFLVEEIDLLTYLKRKNIENNDIHEFFDKSMDTKI